MGEWRSTAYVRTGNIIGVGTAIAALLRTEQYEEVLEGPGDRDQALHEAPRWMEKTSGDACAIAILPGAVGWTVVKSRPQNLLCTAAGGRAFPRLAHLAFGLGCDAAYASVEDGEAVFVLQCSASLSAVHMCGQRLGDEALVAAAAEAFWTGNLPHPTTPRQIANFPTQPVQIERHPISPQLIAELHGLTFEMGPRISDTEAVHLQLGGSTSLIELNQIEYSQLMQGEPTSRRDCVVRFFRRSDTLEGRGEKGRV